ncbi:hypothetical protein BJF91_22845 [Allorhizobium taibaishanense]|uniref:Uncharacterized protein n=1 Tax=Allorhizobium taibaishanense TaxID=887144 RepID=A0A1Q9AA95_9HYPH|nr:hypothetical protein BJF91_22845 [Allorhizobium taibaishanense]
MHAISDPSFFVFVSSENRYALFGPVLLLRIGLSENRYALFGPVRHQISGTAELRSCRLAKGFLWSAQHYVPIFCERPA